ncbi:hypothetical protein [Nocardia sp. NPDC057227]|uniref:hypothetical protein n=1 Tax=Nocardia sp. NPDC057227 TaxID=3346056 RepID=UPI00363E84C4
MNEYRGYVITVSDTRLSELIDAVHRAVAGCAETAEHNPGLAVADLAVDREPCGHERSVAGITVWAGAALRVNVVFSLAGATAIARLHAAPPGPDALAAHRQVVVARTLTMAAMADLLGRGVAADLTRLAA